MIEPLEQLFLAHRKTLYSLDHYADLALWWRPGDAREWLNLIREAPVSELPEAPVSELPEAPVSELPEAPVDDDHTSAHEEPLASG